MNQVFFRECPDLISSITVIPLQIAVRTMKRCADCREWKPLEEFPRNRNYKDGAPPVLQAVP